MSEGFLALKNEIQEITNKKIREILDEAQKRAEKIYSDGEKKAEEIKLKKIKESEAQASVIRLQKLSEARLKVKMNFQNKKQEIIEDIYAEGFTKLQDIVNSEEYKTHLHHFVVDGGVALQGGQLEVFVPKQDKDKIDPKKCADEIKSKTEQTTSLKISQLTRNTIGGCIVKKGRIIVDNTIEAIFERKKRDIRLALAKILFER
ncbi:MAG: V-type ATP synthase subunit E [Candidatus Hodarchaeota archaeon]